MLDSSDDEIRGLRFRPLIFGGASQDYFGDSSCNSSSLIKQPQGGFSGDSNPKTANDYKDFHDLTPGGRAPLALAIGHDDHRGGGKSGNPPGAIDEITGDVLDAFRVMFQSSPTADCAPAFTIIITDGKDSCSGDINSLTGGEPNFGYCNTPVVKGKIAPCDVGGNPEIGTANFPMAVGSSNRRSAISSVNTLRTHFVRKDAALKDVPDGPKEVMSWVICFGSSSLTDIRTCNAMALAGGTHTEGVIEHDGPEGFVGTVNLDDTTVSGDAGLKALGLALGIDTNTPENAHLDGCRFGQEREDDRGVCTIDGQSLFDNSFLDPSVVSSTVLDSTVLGTSFAFFVDDAGGLKDALELIASFIGVLALWVHLRLLRLLLHPFF